MCMYYTQILAQIMAVLLTKRNESSQNKKDPKLIANVLIETTGDTGPGIKPFI